MNEKLKSCPWGGLNSSKLVTLSKSLYYVRCDNHDCPYSPSPQAQGWIDSQSTIIAWNNRHE